MVTAHLLLVRELPLAHALDVLPHAALVCGAGDDHNPALGVPLQQHLQSGTHDALVGMGCTHATPVALEQHHDLCAWGREFRPPRYRVPLRSTLWPF